MPLPSLLYGLTNSLQPVRRAWMQAVGRVLADTGITTSLATAVLLVSRIGPGASQKALAYELGVHPAALVRLLDQGEASGLLARAGVKDDRRTKVVSLLPAGRRLADQVEKALEELRQELLGDIPPADVETATRVLRLLEERVVGWL